MTTTTATKTAGPTCPDWCTEHNCWPEDMGGELVSHDHPIATDLKMNLWITRCVERNPEVDPEGDHIVLDAQYLTLSPGDVDRLIKALNEAVELVNAKAGRR